MTWRHHSARRQAPVSTGGLRRPPAWAGLLAVAAAALLTTAGCGSRAAYPAKPVILVCPWSAGGGTDRVSRQIAAQLERELGVPVNVVNATGGGGVTGHTRGALARPDGYTLTMATVELNMLHWRGLTSVSPGDFEPLVLLNRDDAAVFVRQDAPWQTLGDLEAAIRRNPGSLKASGTARGGIWHIALAGWLVTGGLGADAVNWISMGGAAPSLQELMAKGIDVVCCSVPEARALLDGGLIRCLGVMAEARLPSHPGLPTFRDAGVDWAVGGWRGIAIPKGVPAERAERLREALLRVARSDEFARFMDAAGFNLSIGDREVFARLLGDMDTRFGAILTSPALAPSIRSPLGPMVFPLLVGGLAAATLAALLWRGALRLEPGTARLTRAHLPRLALVPGAVVFFLLVSETLGFVLAAGAMLAGLLVALRVRVRAAVALTAVLVPAVYHLFAVKLGVPLPWGWWGW